MRGCNYHPGLRRWCINTTHWQAYSIWLCTCTYMYMYMYIRLLCRQTCMIRPVGYGMGVQWLTCFQAASSNSSVTSESSFLKVIIYFSCCHCHAWICGGSSAKQPLQSLRLWWWHVHKKDKTLSSPDFKQERAMKVKFSELELDNFCHLQWQWYVEFHWLHLRCGTAPLFAPLSINTHRLSFSTVTHICLINTTTTGQKVSVVKDWKKAGLQTFYAVLILILFDDAME